MPLGAFARRDPSGASHLKAAVYRRYGPPDVIRIEDVPTPDPEPHELLVRVRAASVSAGDARLRSARVPPGFGLVLRLAFGIIGPRKPILGWDFAGEVAAVGSLASGFAPGDRVFGARMGSHAEYVTVSTNSVAAMPRNLTFEDATALVFGGMTSLIYLRDKAKIQPGERVLINGASGAVGTAAVQLAKHFGAVVTGVCSASNAELVRSLGAARVIDYAKQDFTQSGETYDIIVDAVGNCTFARCERALSPGGRLLLVVVQSGSDVGRNAAPVASRTEDDAGVGATRAEDLTPLSGKYRRVRRLHSCGRSNLPIRAHRRCSRTCRYRTQEGQRRGRSPVRVALAPGFADTRVIVVSLNCCSVQLGCLRLSEATPTTADRVLGCLKGSRSETRSASRRRLSLLQTSRGGIRMASAASRVQRAKSSRATSATRNTSGVSARPLTTQSAPSRLRERSFAIGAYRTESIGREMLECRNVRASRREVVMGVSSGKRSRSDRNQARWMWRRYSRRTSRHLPADE